MILLLLAVLAGCGGEEKADEARPAPNPVKEVTAPSGKPKGVMLIFPAGGWFPEPKAALRTTDHYEGRYRKLGWLAVNVGYRPGGEEGYDDVVAAYESARKDNPGVPVCAVGESSGGHLALMLAARRPLDCVESVGAPTDLTRLRGLTKRVAVRAFGRGALAKWSPVRHAARIRGRVMIVQAAGDLIVAPAQARAMKAAKPGAELIVLPQGRLGFMHLTKVDKAAYKRYLAAEERMLVSVARTRRR